ncbi:MAG TPA: helix-turn-helix domain-containing protein [Mycobacteriales bacterium]|nr:helix-turn-helix domain-containing protein [Mycobacteriales bacterium]
MALRDVVAVVWDGVGAFGLGVACEVFGYDRTASGLPGFEFAVAAEVPGVVRTDTGLRIVVEHDLSRLHTADLVLVLGWEDPHVAPPEALLQALRDAVGRGARVMSHCSGAFVVAAAGLLDGRRCTTHWMWSDELARRFPLVQVDPGVLYVEDGPVISSAGTAAGIDTCLHLIRQEFGAAVANEIARRMVVPPYREGGQAQYVQVPVSLPGEAAGDSSRLREALAWAQENLAEPLSVEALARRSLMSPRSFARHFRAATGTTPHAWLLAQRLQRAQHLLESSDLSVDEVAQRCGFGAATTLRGHFASRFGTSPQAYRKTFRAPVLATTDGSAADEPAA